MEQGRRGQRRTSVLVLMGLLMSAVVAVSLVLSGSAQIIPTLPFKDSDDVIRMLQAAALRDGGGWYDVTLSRLDPPGGVVMHWSRWPDLPLLAALVIAEPLVGRDQALLIAAIAVPALLGAAFFAAFVWAARPLAGPGGLIPSALIAVASTIPFAAFAGGRVDHHGWQLLLAALSAGAVLRLLAAAGEPPRAGARGRSHDPPERSAHHGLAVLAGACGALGLWVGAEAIPWLALSTAVLALGWLRQGASAAALLRSHGAALTLGTALLLPVALPPAAWESARCDTFSLVSVALAGAVFLFGLAAAAHERWIPRAEPGGRLLSGALSAMVLLAALYALFPHCAAGPYAGISANAALLVSRVKEAQPLLAAAAERPALAAQFAVLPVLATALAGWRSAVCRGGDRSVWLGAAVLAGGGLALELWQLRTALLANLYAGLVLCWWAAAAGARAGEAKRLWTRLWRRGGPALVVAVLPAAASALAGTLSDRPADEEAAGCDIRAVAAVLNGAPFREGPPLLIAAPVNTGAPLLYLTRHHVLAAPYHRNAAGLRDNALALHRPPDEARTAIERRGIDALLICNGEAVLDDGVSDETQTLYRRLLAGKVPDWLNPVLEAEDTTLFIVNPSAPPAAQAEAAD